MAGWKELKNKMIHNLFEIFAKIILKAFS